MFYRQLQVSVSTAPQIAMSVTPLSNASTVQIPQPSTTGSAYPVPKAVIPAPIAHTAPSALQDTIWYPMVARSVQSVAVPVPFQADTHARDA